MFAGAYDGFGLARQHAGRGLGCSRPRRTVFIRLFLSPLKARSLACHLLTVRRKEAEVVYGYGRRTDDVDADGDVDGALVARRDALVAAGVRRAHLHEVEMTTVVGVHVVRQRAAAAAAVVQARPAQSRRHAALRSTAHRRVRSQLQILVQSHPQKLQPLCVRHATRRIYPVWCVGPGTVA